MKLLIVDDQIYVAQGLRFGIDWKAEGFSEVFIALNALEARTVLQKNAVDVMLCDIEMPGESGIEYCSEKRSFQDFRRSLKRIMFKPSSRRNSCGGGELL